MSKENNRRKFPDGSSPRPDLSKIKKEEAIERQTYYNTLSIEEKIARLDDKLGKGIGAKKQRAQFQTLLNAPKSVERQIEDINSSPDTAPKKKLKAKERRQKAKKEH